VCYLRGKRGRHWDDGMTMGLHSKHFIVDDVCTYIGSQNLYICDLAEVSAFFPRPFSLPRHDAASTRFGGEFSLTLDVSAHSVVISLCSK